MIIPQKIPNYNSIKINFITQNLGKTIWNFLVRHSVQLKTVAYVVINKIKRSGYFANARINKMVAINRSKLLNFTILLENCFMDLLTKIFPNLHHNFFR